jgi:hypothetical protein
MPSTEVCSDDWWLDRHDQNRCVAVRKNGERCLKPANRGTTVCRTHGGGAPQVKRKAKERLELAADRMARELLGMATGAESEAVKLNAIRDALDRAGLGAKTEVSLEIKPWEQLMGDIAGVATISRAEHHAQHGRAFLETTALGRGDRRRASRARRRERPRAPPRVARRRDAVPRRGRCRGR